MESVERVVGQPSRDLTTSRLRRMEGPVPIPHRPRYESLLLWKVKTRIRLEEAVWGGVPKDGIPDLINPPSVTPQDAWYMNPTDRVFGVSINGEHRAFPLWTQNPHEMANDVLGGG